MTKNMEEEPCSLIMMTDMMVSGKMIYLMEMIMIYANGDVYEGQWYLGKRNGYGVLTKRNGDHFEGKWVNDKREGQGSYFYSSKNKVFVGEWVND